jgi:hypothetical protein
MFVFNTAKAETLWERGNIEKHGVFTKEQILERGGSWEETKEFFQTWSEIGNTFLKVIDWINHAPENIPKVTVKLLASVYEFLSGTLLLVPTSLFSNAYSVTATLKFAGVGILAVIILTMIEGIKRMCKKQTTDLQTVSKRFFLAVAATGFAPFLFTSAFQLINMVTKAISKIGAGEMTQFGLFGEIPFANWQFTAVDTFLLILFDLLVIALLKPIILQTGRRWWNLLCLFQLTPLALIGWIFDDYRHYLSKWWSSLKLLAQSQLVYAIYICIMGVFIFGSRILTSGGSLFIELIIILGGLSSMTNPPSFVKSRVSQGDDTFFAGIKDSYKSIVNAVKSVTPNPIQKAIARKVKHGTTSVTELRKKTGKRYVGNL